MRLLTVLVLLSIRLLAQGPDLSEAARKDDVALAARLLAAGADASKPDAGGYTPLILAAYNGSPEVAKLLLKNHADVHAQNVIGNALMAAAFKGEAAIVQALLDAGARVNDANRSGGTALMFAALSARVDVVKLLLAKGADPALRDQRRLDAAALAEQQGSQELAALLRAASKKPR